MKDENLELFDLDEFTEWHEHWQDMPEFIQEDNWGFQSIILRFNSQEDVENFAKLINQKITVSTKYLWFPEINYNDENKIIGMNSKKRYVDES